MISVVSAWQLGILLDKRSNTVNPGNEQDIDERTIGIAYHINPKMRVTLNYLIRAFEAPNDFLVGGDFIATPTPLAGIPPGQSLPPLANQATNNLQTVLDTIENRMTLQFTYIF